MMIAANKGGPARCLENYERLKKQFPAYHIVACSADFEPALREASKHGVISYIPGEKAFTIKNESSLNEKQKLALSAPQQFLLQRGSTGVQEVLNDAAFELLRYKPIFPGGVGKLEDSEGRVIPDCFLYAPGGDGARLRLPPPHRLRQELRQGNQRQIEDAHWQGSRPRAGQHRRDHGDEIMRQGFQMYLIVVRHGESEDNREHVHQGWRASRLTPLGKRQAELLAQRLAKEEINVVYASDLDRVQESLEPLRRLMPHLQIITTPLLREQGKGSLEGERKDLVANVPDWNFGRFGGEEHVDFLARLSRFLADALREHKDGTICVYTHGGPAGRLTLQLLGLPGDRFKEFGLNNACFHILKREGDRWVVELKNEGGHLGADAAQARRQP